LNWIPCYGALEVSVLLLLTTRGKSNSLRYFVTFPKMYSLQLTVVKNNVLL